MPDSRRAGSSIPRASSDARIPHSRPSLGAREVEALADVVGSGQLAHGQRVAELEAMTAELLLGGGRMQPGSTHAVAVSSGTAALFVALQALDVGPDDEVLVPSYTCASLNQAVLYTGATPRYVDCDPVSLNPDPADAARKLSRRTAACIVPHMFGLPAEIEAFVALGPPVIEDCAQTLGVNVGGRPVGAWGRLAVCSFYATKLVAAGEGGMVVSSDPALAARAAGLRDCDDPASSGRAFNFKMSDLHAAVGLVQLARLSAFLQRRRRLARRYLEDFSGLDIELPAPGDTGEHAWFRFVVRLPDGTIEPVLERCEAQRLDCRRPVGSLVAAVEAQLDDLPGCREVWRRACSVPLYPVLDDEAVAMVVDRFRRAVLNRND